jgi:hypothetical protein
MSRANKKTHDAQPWVFVEICLTLRSTNAHGVASYGDYQYQRLTNNIIHNRREINAIRAEVKRGKLGILAASSPLSPARMAGFSAASVPHRRHGSQKIFK